MKAKSPHSSKRQLRTDGSSPAVMHERTGPKGATALLEHPHRVCDTRRGPVGEHRAPGGQAMVGVGSGCRCGTVTLEPDCRPIDRFNNVGL